MFYTLDQCAFFKLRSTRRLCTTLQVSNGRLMALLERENNYNRFRQAGRWMEEPKPMLKRVQRRVHKLLARVHAPSYLHSAVKGRSYRSNAEVHDVVHPTIKLDIKSFFRAARAAQVYHFFLDTMSCASDVAGILTRLTTVDGHLPTGGNASTILSYYAYHEMFDELSELANAHGCVLTVYVDDITITGKKANGELAEMANNIIRSYRLKSHKYKRFEAGQARVITGVAMTLGGSKLPNIRHMNIATDFRLLSSTSPSPERIAILRRLNGRVQEAKQFDIRWNAKAKELVEELGLKHKHRLPTCD